MRTMRHLQQWLTIGNISESAVFHRLVGRNGVGSREHVDMIPDILKLGNVADSSHPTVPALMSSQTR